MHVISLGGGVQSTVMLLMAEREELAPLPSAAIFADTGWEPEYVYQHLSWLQTQTSIPISRVSAGNLREATWNGRRHDGQHGFSTSLISSENRAMHKSHAGSARRTTKCAPSCAKPDVWPATHIQGRVLPPDTSPNGWASVATSRTG